MAAGPVPDDLELHRPYVDDVVLTCPECGGEMRRVDEVIDAWFDSGSMPFGAVALPVRERGDLRGALPGRLHLRGHRPDARLVLQPARHRHAHQGGSSYKRVLCLGHILDADGQKMSKSRGNVVQPDEILDDQGADAFRWYMFAGQSPWAPRRFGPEMVDEVVRKFLLTLWNTYSFFTVYANIDRFDPDAERVPLSERPLLDRWLVGELNALVQTVTDGLEEYDATNSARAIQAFVDDLSNWYVRRSRRRFWKSENDRDKLAAYQTLYEALVTLHQAARAVHAVHRRGAVPEPGAQRRSHGARRACTCAPGRWSTSRPSTPACRSTWRRRGASSRWAAPRATPRRSRRASRWPRWSSAAAEAEQRAAGAPADVVVDELNVKELRFVGDGGELVSYTVKPNLRVLGPRLGKRLGALQAALRDADGAALVAELRRDGGVRLAPDGDELYLLEEELLIETGSPEGYQVESDGSRTVALKTAVDEALREEGVARELVHAVQLARKNADLRIEDTISLALDVPDELRPLVERFAAAIKAETLASEFSLGEARGDHRETARVEGREIGIGLSVTGTIFTVTYG